MRFFHINYFVDLILQFLNFHLFFINFAFIIQQVIIITFELFNLNNFIIIKAINFEQIIKMEQ